MEWDLGFKPKDWYFFTGRPTVWRLRREAGYEHRKFSEKLIEFIWRGTPQDYEWFCKKWWDDDGALKPVDKPAVETIEAVSLPTTYTAEILGKDPFSIDDMVAAGVFLTDSDLEQMIERLKLKKNLILQGAPGVGKTFMARMLAYALMAEKDDDRIQFVQFHQTYSYEDFVRGYRPLPDQGGTFGLQDSVFFKFCKHAESDPDPERKYVFIIDEINRGNLSQIFGELLMLIEADKRGPKHSVELVYHRPGERRFYVPPNVYIMGLMNLADRSLAVVDYALRRRFAFVSLTPQYESELYKNWLLERKMNGGLVDLIVRRVGALNHEICDDPLLGENFQVGHSFFCPKGDDFSGLDRHWYESIVHTEIVPLLKEYWFDNPKRLDQARERLLAK